ncbi:DM13 domain-containing protein [Spirosoma linguale]|uniref:Electron transfer DM13 n=1 Tax=Spirosoma linguale (strain ATCC 33905 / DSM 74 / LMG 10896 / Claus 1) TaxID=504472 RepID=D2QGM0_SPILD|nr:Electron transfer DM13 [Spirosoma linguale DSM 74]
MKIYLYALAFGVAALLLSCVKSPELVPVQQALPGVTSPISATTGATSGTAAMSSLSLVSAGTFVNEVHAVSGKVSLYANPVTGQRYLAFENFTSDSGPELHVYLAEDRSLTNYIDVGRLTNTGTFYYEIPAGSKANQQTVLIWCRPFSVLFGSAQLKVASAM